MTLNDENQCTWRWEKSKKLSIKIYKGLFEKKYGTNFSNKLSNILIFGISVEEKKENIERKKLKN